MHFTEYLRNTLRRLQGEENLLAFSKRVGVDRAMLARFMNGERGMTIDSIQKIFDNLGFKVFAPDELVAEPPTALEVGDFTLLPRVRPFSDLATLEAGAQDNSYAFRTDFLRSLGFETLGDMVLLAVMVNAMEPTINEMDVVLVSLKDQDVYSGQIYVIRIDGELVVGRLVREPGKIVVKSDNPMHGQYDVQPNLLDVIGRVRWQGRLYGGGKYFS